MGISTNVTVAINKNYRSIDFQRNKRALYRIDFARCDTSAEVLDWIIQISKKTWATDELLGKVIRLIDQALRPQENLCCQGKEQGPIDVSPVIKKNLTPA